MQREARPEALGDAESYEKSATGAFQITHISYTRADNNRLSRWRVERIMDSIIQELARTIGISLDALDK